MLARIERESRFKSREDINGIKDMPHDDVVKFLACSQIFGIGANEIELRMVLLGDVNQPLTNFTAFSRARQEISRS